MTFFTVSVLALSLSLSASPSPNKKGPGKRELIRRALTIEDATKDVEINVAGGSPTTLLLPQNIAKHLLIDSKGYFVAANQQRAGRLFVLLPEKDLPVGEAVSLQLILEDKTSLPPIILVSRPEKVDLNVELTVNLKNKASSESAAALKIQLSEAQSKLDECQQSGGEKGAVKVAELVLKQDIRRPVSFVVERHPAKELDKQSRLLVETHHVYRLFDLSYLVMTVENRDPDKLWILEKAEISVAGGGSAADTRVVDVAQDMAGGIPPGEESKMVVAFKTPEQSSEQRFNVKLLEKNGNRHVELKDLKF